MAFKARSCMSLLPNLNLYKLRTVGFKTTTIRPGFPGFKIKDKLHSRQIVQDFLFQLSHKERTILFEELQRFQTQAVAIKENVQADPPTTVQLKLLAAHSAMPFIGFGFLDNLIMILAGDYIDTTIGVTLGISTMAAAGMGNTLSDVAGIGSAYYVERFASKIGVKSPDLSPVQITMSRSRWCINLGRAFGVTVGCLLGMFPLLFRHTKDTKECEEKE